MERVGKLSTESLEVDVMLQRTAGPFRSLRERSADGFCHKLPFANLLRRHCEILLRTANQRRMPWGRVPVK
jgi:hypothetical protein